MPKKIRVGIFFGGISPEHEISISSAEGIISNIDRKKFEVLEIFIDKKGEFMTGKNVLGKVKSGKASSLNKLNINKLSSLINVAFPVLHGAGGEDGSVQGFFEVLKIPFVGCGIASSAISLDKSKFKELMKANSIAQAKFETLDFKYSDQSDIEKRIVNVKKNFKFPIFMKPSRTGSSLGIYKIKNPGEIEKYIRKSRKFDSKIIIEESVENAIEIEVSVLGNSESNIQASLPGKVIPEADFYDFEDKYKKNKTKFEIPAILPGKKIKEIQDLAVKAYKIALCEGLSRVDFLLNRNLKICINEINTLPGFTPISMYPKMWKVGGLKYKDLITKLIVLAMKKI